MRRSPGNRSRRGDVVDMIIGEHQNRGSNGGHRRLTIWRDGHSEVEVVPMAQIGAGPPGLTPKDGWTVERQEHRIRFLRRDTYPLAAAHVKLQQALEAGIARLETFPAAYLDGSGTRVVVRIDGKERETVIPVFMDNDKGSRNYRRFMAVSKILDGFDSDAFTDDGR
jgi:hypothetical protein